MKITAKLYREQHATIVIDTDEPPESGWHWTKADRRSQSFDLGVLAASVVRVTEADWSTDNEGVDTWSVEDPNYDV
jgi:hypothetical protein